jgi:hypothetical protein
VETSINENHKAKFDDVQNVWSSLQTEFLLEAFSIQTHPTENLLLLNHVDKIKLGSQ